MAKKKDYSLEIAGVVILSSALLAWNYYQSQIATTPTAQVAGQVGSGVTLKVDTDFATDLVTAALGWHPLVGSGIKLAARAMSGRFMK